MKALKFLQLEPKRPLTLEKLKRVHKMIMHQEKHPNGKDMLIRGYRKTPVFAGLKTFSPVSAIKVLMNDVLHRHYSSNDDDSISAVVKLFADMINTHPFEDENGRLCQVMLPHVLVQASLSLFLVLLSSFHKPGRKHCI